jgi:hypothetical protein
VGVGIIDTEDARTITECCQVVTWAVHQDAKRVPNNRYVIVSHRSHPQFRFVRIVNIIKDAARFPDAIDVYLSKRAFTTWIRFNNEFHKQLLKYTATLSNAAVRWPGDDVEAKLTVYVVDGRPLKIVWGHGTFLCGTRSCREVSCRRSHERQE